jgi:NAD(P)-dependent dehydrogenase (short-subunit alcohol dehydrogenase family)
MAHPEDVLHAGEVNRSLRADLGNRVAIVTGGTEGIGRAIALRFAASGAQVAACGRDAEKGERLLADAQKAGLSDLIFVRADASVPTDVHELVGRTVDRFGHVDVLVSNVGLITIATAPETSVEEWHRVLDVNLGSPFLLAKYGVPVLAEAGGGSIVLIAGELGLVGARESVAYCAAKGGVINMTRALAVDCAPLDIRVNCLCPGPVRTPLLERWFLGSDDPAALEAAQTEPVLLRRVARPEEIAEVALFLASGASSYMTGSILVADGGLTAWYGM